MSGSEMGRLEAKTAGEGGLRSLTEKEFALLRDLIQQKAGIHLSDAKKPLLVGRLSRRLRELGVASFLQYYRYVTEVDPGEQVTMLDCISTNETRFFREPRQFEFLEKVLAEWSDRAGRGSRRRAIRAWSAACSTGEEPYSLAMALLSRFPPGSGWEIEILATDLSTRVLDRAAAAVWPLEKSRDIPEVHLKSFMLRGTGPQDGQMKAGPEIRSVVRFKRQNLHADRYDVGGPFDLIFCRNVLIYFDGPTRARVVTRLLSLLASDGYLFLGHAESLAGQTGVARGVGPAIYSKAASATAAAQLPR